MPGPVQPGAPEPSSVLIEGPWRHREVAANGSRFHVAELGDGPLVLLLHGFPQFWWSWRAQLVALAEAGFRAVAPDLRGYGDSAKPPRGYDAYTLSSDVAGLVRALGEDDAVLAGQDWGGFLGWTAAALHPGVVRRLVVLSAAHPLRQRAALAVDPRGQLLASAQLFRAQVPRVPERRLTSNDAEGTRDLLHAWSGPRWPDPAAEARYRTAIQIPGVAHCSLEYSRWLLRSALKPSGLRLARLLQEPVQAAVLQLHGELDTAVLARTAQGSGRYVRGEYEWRLLPDVGHFLSEEAPNAVNEALVRWAKGP